MKKRILPAIGITFLLAVTPRGFTQEAQTPAVGFRVERFVFELSLFLPAPRDRDPQLFLSAAQIEALIPLVRQLLERPFPTPSQAKRIQSAVDGILTSEQKQALAKLEGVRQPEGASRAPGASGPPSSMGAASADRQRSSADERQVRPLSSAERKRRALAGLLALLEQAEKAQSR